MYTVLFSQFESVNMSVNFASRCSIICPIHGVLRGTLQKLSEVRLKSRNRWSKSLTTTSSYSETVEQLSNNTTELFATISKESCYYVKLI